MKYWQIAYPDETGKFVTEVFSDDKIIKEYWQYWYGKMINKFGKEYVDKNYSQSDCINDWTVINWAVRVVDDN